MTKNSIIAIILLIISAAFNTPEAKNFEFSAKAGINLGGTSPMGLPAEIRAINVFKPTFAFSIEGDVKRNFNEKWGLMAGIRFEVKGMSTDATVKNYQILLQYEGAPIEGVFTGNVETKVKNSYITIPVAAVYDISKRWSLRFGGYMSFMVDGEFSGNAYNGYMHDGSPIGERIDNVDAPYDFSEDMRKIDAGVLVGADFVAYKHLLIYGDLAWGCVPLFDKNFTALSFNMYNVYLNLGFGYLF